MDAELPFSGAFPGPTPCLHILDARAPLALWISDSGGRVGPLSPGFLAISGIRLEEVRGAGWKGRLDDAELSACRNAWSLCRAAGTAWEREFRLRDGDGRARHVLSRGMPARDATGRVQGWVGLNLDVTDVREAEGELRRFRERVLLALCAGGDYLYEIDPAAGTRRWFGPVSDLLGRAPAGRPEPASAWLDSVLPGDRAALAAALSAGGDFRLEYRLRRADGSVVRLLDRGRTLPGDGEGPGYLIGIVTELTESMGVESGPAAREDGTQAGRRMEVVGRLAGGIAHDFNNLLTAINGFSELLANVLEDEGQRGYALEILRAGERAALITRQLLAFSSRQILAPRVLDLNAAARDIGRRLPALLGEDLAVVVRGDPRGAFIKADPAQVEQMFTNLANHARGAMPMGGRLTIEIGRAEAAGAEDTTVERLQAEGAEAAEAAETAGVAMIRLPEAAPDGAASAEAGPRASAILGGPYVVLTVGEEGEGLGQEELARLFEPFYLPSHGRPQGLGLSAVYGIVKQNGGHIVACSRPGEGTLFRIHWPRWTGERPREAEAAGAPMPEAHPVVLVAEDEENTRSLVRDVLEQGGFRVLTAASGQEALDILTGARSAPDLLLTDVVMPGMGGLELAGRLSPRRPDLKVLFMSGYLDNPAVRQGVFESGRSFIRKPFTPLTLLAKVQEVLTVPQAA